MNIQLSFLALLLFSVLAALYGIRRYRTPFNPLTFFSGYHIGLITLVSGWVAYRNLSAGAYTEADMMSATLLSGVYLLGVTLAYYLRTGALVHIFGNLMRFCGLSYESIARRFSRFKFILLMIGAVASFIALALVGGGGSLWLTNSRQAYITYRAGAGPFYAATQWFLMFALAYYLWARRPQRLRLVITAAIFSVLFYFMGSKGHILAVIMLALIYYNFMVKPFSTAKCLLLAPLLFLGVLILLVMQGSFDNLADAIYYFNDYFATTAQFLARFDEFGLMHGRGFLSDFWFFVPRALYPDKPFEYGVILIHKVLFPGAAATGSTPGILPWALAYLDFGGIGVFLSGLAIGLWQKIVYEHYLRNRQVFFAFVFMVQLCLWPIMAFAPFIIFITWCIIQGIYLRLSMRSRLKPVTGLSDLKSPAPR